MNGPPDRIGEWQRFETRVPGKWVLAGEHAVLRGVPAVALPHPELGLAFRFEPSAGKLQINPPQTYVILKEMLAAEFPDLDSIPGRLAIESTIPFGAGLGSSAALCVAVARWLSGRLGISDTLAFATRLENHFHGKSSGMDIAVASVGSPVRFVFGEGAVSLGVKKLPRFTFHDTRLRAKTSVCVAQVAAFGVSHPPEGERVDQMMREASLSAVDGLARYDAGDVSGGLERVARAMDLSHECFEAWGLVPAAARDLRRNLAAQGARASKLTGAGCGGMVVALWD